MRHPALEGETLKFTYSLLSKRSSYREVYMHEEENDIYINFQLSFLPILSSFMKKRAKEKKHIPSLLVSVLIMGYPSCIKMQHDKSQTGKTLTSTLSNGSASDNFGQRQGLIGYSLRRIDLMLDV